MRQFSDKVVHAVHLPDRKPLGNGQGALHVEQTFRAKSLHCTGKHTLRVLQACSSAQAEAVSYFDRHKRC